MDAIYDDLENYTDAEEIERLRNENNNLRSRLDAQSVALEKLKNDYDKLIEDHNKLEKNYSSLLKTARNEIERKTQTITNLNIDKDRMVLNYVSRGRRRNIISERPYCTLTSIKKNLHDTNKLIELEHQKSLNEKDNTKLVEESSNISNIKNVVITPDNKQVDENTLKEFNPEKRLSSLSKTLVALEKGDNIEENKSKSSDQSESKTKVEKKPLRLRDRRKSMPILSNDFSTICSDEEWEDFREKLKSKETNTRYRSKDSTDRRYTEINGSTKGKNSSKTPSIEERKSSHYHESKLLHKSSRWENEKVTRDQYEMSWMRRHSPGKHGRRDPRFEKFDKRRTRVLVSPPYNKYDKYNSKSIRDPRHYDKPQPYDFDKHRYYDEKPTKHKLAYDYKEPVKKRPRFEPERNHPVVDKIRYDIEMESDSLAETLQRLESQYASCQSPDYEHMDALASHPLKEIKHIASSPVDDPRMKNTRYILSLDDNGKKNLSTVAGRSIEIKPINREKWCLPKINVPPPLVNKPLPSENELIQDIYTDIDNTVVVDHNISLESGEIPELLMTSKSNSDINEPNEIKNKLCKNEKLEINQHTNKDFKLVEQVKDPKQTESSKSVKVSVDKTRISKVKNTDSKILKVGNENKCKPEETPSISLENGKNTEKKSKKEKDLPMLISTHIETEQKPTGTTENKKSCHYIENLNSVKGIVEGDLELSDETSDNTEVRKYINKSGKNLETKTKDKEIISKNCNKNTAKDKIKTVKENNVERNKIVLDSCSNASKKDKKAKAVSPVSSVKTRSRRKSQKQPDLEKVESITMTTEEKKNQSKKGKESKEKGSKFKEIFGTDSSSLITPEDLGMVTIKATSEKYVPFFEDAQDAIDVEEIAKVKQGLIAIEKSLKPKHTIVNDSVNNAVEPETKVPDKANLTPINSGTTTVIKDKLLTVSSTRELDSPLEIPRTTDSKHSDKLVASDTHSDSNKVSHTIKVSAADMVNLGTVADPALTINYTVDKEAAIVVSSDSHNFVPLNMDKVSPVSIDRPKPIVVTAPLVKTAPIVTNKGILNDSAPVSNPTPETDRYANLNAENVKDPDVVQTIIISTGVQPQCIENSTSENLVVCNNVEQLCHATMPNENKFKNLDPLTALATSTPNKYATAPEVHKVNESSSFIDANKVSMSEQSQSSVCTVSKNENDIPNVRIFLQRKRRIRKKPAP